MPHHMHYFKMSQNILETTQIMTYWTLALNSLKRTHILCCVVKCQRTYFSSARCFLKRESHHMSQLVFPGADLPALTKWVSRHPPQGMLTLLPTSSVTCSGVSPRDQSLEHKQHLTAEKNMSVTLQEQSWVAPLGKRPLTSNSAHASQFPT